MRLKKEKLLKPQLQSKTGYYTVNIYKVTCIHRIVALAFIPNPLNKPQVNHINGIKSDNRVENLEWVTAKENTKHSWEKGLSKSIKGESYKSKLTEKEVLEIRQSKLNQKELSVLYKVNIPSINLIINRKTWKHL